MLNKDLISSLASSESEKKRRDLQLSQIIQSSL